MTERRCVSGRIWVERAPIPEQGPVHLDLCATDGRVVEQPASLFALVAPDAVGNAAPIAAALMALLVTFGCATWVAGRGRDAFQRRLERALALGPAFTMSVVAFAVTVVGSLEHQADIAAEHVRTTRARLDQLRSRTVDAVALIEGMAPGVDPGDQGARDAVRAALVGANYGGADGYLFVMTRGAGLASRPWGDARRPGRHPVAQARRSAVEHAAIEAAAAHPGAFISYEWPSLETGALVPKVGFVARAPRWGWVLGSSVQVEDLRREYAVAVDRLERAEWTWLLAIVIGSCALVMVSLVVGRRIARDLDTSFEEFSRRLADGLERRAPIEGFTSPCSELELAATSVNTLLRAEWDRAAQLEESQRELMVANARAVDLATRAERASQAKADFLARVSHGLGTPLHAILGYLELIHAEAGPTTRALSTTALENARWLQSKVDELLGLTAHEDASDRGTWTWFDPSASVASTVESYRQATLKAGLAMDVEVDSGVPASVFAHERTFARVTDALLAHAVRSTIAGGVRVRLTYAASVLELEVRDACCVLDPPELEALFEPFAGPTEAEAQPTAAPVARLAIADRLARLLGGRLKARSQPGEGTTLTFRAPFEAGAAARRATGERAVRGLVGGAVLIVDDVLVNRRLASAMLARSGVQAKLASDGREALELMRRASFDLVLMDCQMPGLDGYATTRAIRAGQGGDAHRGVPVVALTASAAADDEARCLDAGMDAYLAKPFTAAALADVVERFIGPRPDGSPPG